MWWAFFICFSKTWIKSKSFVTTLTRVCLLCFFASKIRTFSRLMAVSSSLKYWLSVTMGNHWSSYYCWWSPCLILSMGVLYFNRSCPAIFMNNNFLKAVIIPNMSIQMIFFVIFLYYKFHIEMFPEFWRFIKIQLNCIRALARHLAALLLVKIFLVKQTGNTWTVEGNTLVNTKWDLSLIALLPGFFIE